MPCRRLAGYYLPDVAFGMQDVGGGAKHLQTRYLVATEELWRFRLSVGYGDGPDRMRGAFGGAEFKACDWAYFIGEYDTKETNVGVRLVTPSIFGYPLNLQVTAKSSLDHRPGNMEFGFGIQFPLGLDHHNRTRLAKFPSEEKNPAKTTDGPAALPDMGNAGERPIAKIPEERTVGKAPDSGGQERLARLQEKLVEAGFQNVRVGANEERLLVVEYENSRFSHNELDGMGVVIGTVAETVPSGYETLRLVMKKKGIRVLQVSAPLKNFVEFMRDPAYLGEFSGSLQIAADVRDDESVRFIGGYGSPSWLRSSLLVYPALKTFVGTDVGTFDYLLSVKLDYFLNTWKGAVVDARLDIPVSWSENFDDGKAFRNNRQSSRFDRLMLFQAIKPLPSVMISLGAGMVLNDAYGTLNEAIWTPGSGDHRFKIKQVYIENSTSHKKNHVYLGSYRYYFNPLDLYLEGTGGKFLDNDKGFNVELKRFFGDTAFSVYYKDSWTTSREHVQVAGVQAAFPLTLRRDMKPYPLQVKGAEEWSYGQETRIVSPGGSNYVSTSIGVNPKPPFDLDRVFYNRDRLSEAYIKRHLLRLRDAYLQKTSVSLQSQETRHGLFSTDN
jgi:hypothetical protein